MRIEVHHYLHFAEPADAALVRVAHTILNKVNAIMLSQTDLAKKLDSLTQQVTKIKTEVSGKLAELADAIANSGTVSQEVQDKLDALTTALAGVDNLVDDAPAAPAADAPSA